METNTTTNHSSVGRGFGSDYLAPKMSAEQQRIKLHRKELMGILELSTLSADDKQRLRRVSADYVIAMTFLPEAEGGEEEEVERLKRTILDYISSDFPDVSDTYTMGLGRALSKDRPPTIMIDGQPLTEAQLMAAYSAIEPSKEVLDRAGEDAAYFPAALAAEPEVIVVPEPTRMIEIATSMSDTWVEGYEPTFDTPHTLKEELLLTTGQVKVLGGKVLALVMRGGISHDHTIGRRAA